jgi:hypothetical protein
MSKNTNKSAPENSILKFLSFICDSIVKGIIDDIIKTAVKTAEVDEQKTKRKHVEIFPFCPADAAIVAIIPLADIGMIY